MTGEELDKRTKAFAEGVIVATASILDFYAANQTGLSDDHKDRIAAIINRLNKIAQELQIEAF